MAKNKKLSIQDKVPGICVGDLWRWQAKLDAIEAALRDRGEHALAAQVDSISGEFAILACPESAE